ncbi:hybrid sensor histidine kinase/response regulator [Kovacikia minuta CCNUW1]|uniref:hybrid sensor histidine kinase/response regulator n=1 Tax=Kovacikia minuta TaxID=2931930 RepID=UPI001CCC7839|nr:hybrid sensor histidine kinase/response regulator [Kovacikia minuta]UBF25274.1 hybrid sensor histidine kinase/response regulator [Kovacikia minuta CCNUW1]
MQEALILVVDDTPANLEVISEALADAGFEVAIAIDGESALKQVQYSQPDLILLDVMMPGISGFETCKRLKNDPVSRDIPIIFMTAVSDPDNKVKGLSLGAVDYITKPFQEAEVLVRIKTHLQLRNLTKNLEQQVEARTRELSQALQELQISHVRLVQQEKMSALGQLVAGIAHEVNNPIGCMVGNLNYTESYFKDLVHHLALYQKYFPEPGKEIVENADLIDLDYLLADLPKVIASMQQSTERICHISHSLRVFSRSDSDRKTPFNIHDGIDSTILILKHRLKAGDNHAAIEVIRDYGNLPLIECFAGQLNQVFMNLLANAIEALEEASGVRCQMVSVGSQSANSCNGMGFNPQPPTITIRTEALTDQVVIRFSDNGVGMSEEVKQRAFDHLFTTKPVGQGTGLGLAIVREIIADKHHGTIAVHSTPGQGTEFIITLPIKG